MALTPEELEAIMERKNKMRREAYDRRNAQENKDEVSAKAVANFMASARIQSCALHYVVHRLPFRVPH